jgi:hypothetical protein
LGTSFDCWSHIKAESPQISQLTSRHPASCVINVITSNAKQQL